MVVIPSDRRHVGRGFDSHQVHQKGLCMTIFDLPWWQQAVGYGVWINYFYWFYVHPILFDGPDKVSTARDSEDGNSAMRQP